MTRFWKRIVLAVAVLLSPLNRSFAQPPLGTAPTKLTGDTTETIQIMQGIVNAAAHVWRWDAQGCTSFTISVINASGASEMVKRQQSQLVAMNSGGPARLWVLANTALKRLFIRAAADAVDDEGLRIIAQGQNLRNWARAIKNAATTASLVVATPTND